MPSRIRSPKSGVLSNNGCTLPLSASRTMLSISTSTFSGSRWIRKPACGKSAISRILESGPQFANHLAQRGTGLFFVRAAPQQADQPFAALVLGLGQSEIADNRACLLGPQFDRATAEHDRGTSHQRDRKPHGGVGHRRGPACSQGLNPGNLSHSEISVPARRFRQLYQGDALRYRSPPRPFAQSYRPAAA